MTEQPFIPPVRSSGRGDGRFLLHFAGDDRAFLVQLLGELRELLQSTDDQPLLIRLFPPAFPDDAEKEAEYQRLMRDELVASRVAAIDSACTVLQGEPDRRGGEIELDEWQLLSFMQAVNAVRLVLGSLLSITDDASAELADDADSPNHHLYGYLGWVLEWTVRALAGTPADAD